MATFIPDKVGASAARSIHIKRSLGRLDDAYIVRTPLRRTAWAPDFFIQHAAGAWLAIAVSDAPFSALASGDLFDTGGSGGQHEFTALLDNLSALPGGADALKKLVVMWQCSADEVARIADRYAAQGVRLMSRARFLDMADTLVPRLLGPIGVEAEYALMGRYFAEAEIDASCTARRHFHRDNAATLQRYFLDYQQEYAAKLDVLPAEQDNITRDVNVRLVNGVAGSGKTLIALARAQLLADMHRDQRILVLIHNAPVVADIHAKLRRLRGRLPDNLEINTFSAWVHRQWRNLHQQPPHMPESKRDVEDLIRRFRTQWPDLKYPERWLREEFDFINEALITTAGQYFNANRAGRGFALRLKERTAIWKLFCAVKDALQQRHLRLWSALPLDICVAQDLQRLERYHHVLIDEAQFCAPSWFRTVRLAMQPGSSLFLCADPNQGFMKHRLSWKSVGLDVAGRTRKLRKSYRTTQAILALAGRVLAQHTQGDPEDFLVPDMRGMTPGAKPRVVYAGSPHDAVERLVNELGASLQAGTLALADVLVIYGDNIHKGLLYERLCKRLGEANIWWFNRNGQRKKPPGGYRRDYLRLANLDTATGLEAGIVLLVGVENLLSGRYRPGLGDDELAALREEDARKLYMAMTRAGAHLVLVSSEPVPAYLADGLEADAPPPA
jgi:hypothetical protein